MGDLPQTSVTPSRLFLNTGQDYGGPFDIDNYFLSLVKKILTLYIRFVES